MYNKFKIIKKIISIALALIMAASPVATFPMQVFAGTGSNGVIKAPTIKLNPALLKMQIGSKIDSAKYEVKDSVAFSVGGSGKVVSEDGTVSSAGIICVTDKETGVEKYVVSDAPSVINYVLEELKKELKSLESLGVDLTVVFENYPNLFGQGPGEDSSPDTANSFNIAAILAAIEALNALAEKANKGEKIDDVSAIEAISKASQAMETIVEEKVQQDPNNEEFRKQLADVQKQTSLFGEASSAVESAASNTSKSQSSNTPKKIEVSKITITGAPEVVHKGQTVQLTAEIEPSNATDQRVMWSSSNEDVAIVSSRGRVTAFGIGQVTITATAGDKIATCTVTVDNPAKSISLSKSQTTISKGKTENLTLTVDPNDTTDSIQVTSSKPEVAEVSLSGNTVTITAKAAGTATITATAGDKTASVDINVLQPVTEFSISGAPANNKVNVGKDFTLKAESFMPNNAHADYKKVEWSSNNTSVATVKKDTGEGTANEAGQATITATAKNGSETPEDWVTNDVIINVLQPVTGIEIEGLPAGNTMDVNATHKLTAKLSPDNVSDAYRTVEWSSDKPGVATVDQNGNVKAIAPGIATITSTAKNRSTDESDHVRRSLFVLVGIVGALTPGRNTKTVLKIPGASQSNPVYFGGLCNTSTTKKEVEYSHGTAGSYDELFFNGAKIYRGSWDVPKGIYVFSGCGTQSDPYILKWWYNSVQAVAGVEIENAPNNIMDVGKTCTLTAKLSPDDVSDDYKKVTWSSDNTAVATVDKSTGVVTAVSGGTATITAKAGGKTATCIVTVKASVESITISGAPDIMNKGDKAKLTAIVSPQGATSNPVKWSTSNDDVLKVDQNTGEIEAVVNNYMLTGAKITATVDGISSSVLIKLVNSKEWLDSAKSVAYGAYEYVDKEEVESNPLYKAWKDAEAAYNSSQTSSNANAMDNARGVYTSAVICTANTFNMILKAVDDAYADTIGFFDNVLIASDAKVIATDGNGNFGVLDGGANLNEEIRLA